MSTKQLALLPREKRRIEHGGEKRGLRHGRKKARPFDPACPLHVTMRSARARGEHSMLPPARKRVIEAIVRRAARRHGIELKNFVNVGNHLHLLVQTRSRRMIPARAALAAFLRESAGLVARAMTGAKKGVAAGEKFWDHLAYSKIIQWGRHLARVGKYFKKNEADAFEICMANSWFEDPPDDLD